MSDNKFVCELEENLISVENKQNKKIYIGQYVFSPDLKIIIRKNEKNKIIKLTDKECAIIEYLSKQDNKLVPREVLLKKVWGYNESVTTHTIETHIYKLRAKIEEDHKNPKFLMNEEGGYRLNYNLR